jgi:hypothetical protein
MISETRLKQTAETVSIELRRSLDKIVALENELALVRHHIERVPPLRRAGRISQRRLAQPNRDGFFGAFNFAPYRARYQRSARIR